MNTTTINNIVRHIFNKNNVKISSLKVNISEPATDLDPDWTDPQYGVEVKIVGNISYKKYKKLVIDVERKLDNLFVDIINVDF